MTEVFPPSSLTAQQLKQIRANVVCEHFGWAPESFAKETVDIANVSLVQAITHAESLLLSQEGVDHDTVQKGIYQLETLLESSIDKQFDLYEMFLLRNTFNIPLELVPWIVLSHQEYLAKPTSEEEEEPTQTTEEALQSYTRELELYQLELEKERQLACAKEYMERKLAASTRQAEEVGALTGSEPLPTLAKHLSTSLPSLLSSLSALLASPSSTISTVPKISSSTTSSTNPEDPWSGSRGEYINTFAEAKVGSLPGAGVGGNGTGSGSAGGLERIQKETMEVGDGGTAQTLLSQIGKAAKDGAV